jgi:hypothetical protein
MTKNDIGELRRSAAAATFGPGAVVDFRAGGATISAIVAGLEEWDNNFPPKGMLNPQAIHEPRLEKKLRVKGFRLPPVRDPSKKETEASKALVSVRFPSWLQCPKCDRIGNEDLWGDEPGRAGRFCQVCTQKEPGRQKIFVIPVRFVFACEAGHVDEFPWHTWVQHKATCTRRNSFLTLKSETAGLAGLILSCPSCNSRRSMDGIFSAETWERFSNCAGRRPWIASANETCKHKPRAVQRGASNLYFPVIESALSIPPWSDRLQDALGVLWEDIIETLPEDRAAHIARLARGRLAPVLAELELSPEQLEIEIERRLKAHGSIDTDNLRLEEFRQLGSGMRTEDTDREFEVRPQQVPAPLSPWISRIVKATRLREVRAMKGFTRILPPVDSNDRSMATLSAQHLDWLPAIEVRGEGIFLELSEASLARWEVIPSVQGRAAELNGRWAAEYEERTGATTPIPVITPRYLLVHTLAHALMRQLTLECGYSSTALRERLYVGQTPAAMAGLLIYTTTTDADGTLGGLQREGDPVRMDRTLRSAIKSQTWCSSDPLCIEGMLTSDGAMSHAACHACVLAPETSCEEFNRFLDRAMLVGTPDNPEIGFFKSLVDGR